MDKNFCHIFNVYNNQILPVIFGVVHQCGVYFIPITDTNICRRKLVIVNYVQKSRDTFRRQRI